MDRVPVSPLTRVKKVLIAGLVLVYLVVSGFILAPAIPRNLAFRQAFVAALGQPADYRRSLELLEPVAEQDCRIHWQISVLALRIDNEPDIETDLHKMLECSPRAVDWLYLIAPLRSDLALQAASLYPGEARTWLWLGDLAQSNGDLARASQYFAESTRHDPVYGLAWCRLGRVDEQRGLLEEAVGAFWQCCQNGDPGSHGCYGAGRVSEQLGDIPNAIRYYRRSHFPPALERAAELEDAQ